MVFTEQQKEWLKNEVVECLRGQSEITKVVIFGSFLQSPSPHDIDIAIFQTSDEGYLPLAMRYRRMIRPVAASIAVDVIPLKAGASGGLFLDEIEQGEVIYER